jgi:threonine dehydrogenase-like Zn-dependent dehydrogenase
MEQFGRPLVKKSLVLPKPAKGEILASLYAIGICGSDLHIWQGEDPRSRLPLILGHESLAVIEDLGQSRRFDLDGLPLEEGDLIAWNRGISCNMCYECVVLKRPYLCPQRWTYGISRSMNEYPRLNGGFATHILLTPQTEILKIAGAGQLREKDYVPWVSACCAGTTVACMYDQAGVQKGDTVLVQGPGPLGVFAVAFARACGAERIIVLGGTQARLDLCREAGATHIINRAQTSLAERITRVREITNGRGANVVMEVAGTVESVEEGLEHAAVGGAYISGGIAVPAGQARIDWFKLVGRKNLTIQGVWVGGARHTYQAFAIYRQYEDSLSKIVSDRFPLTEADAALAALAARQTMKAVLIP